MIGVEDVAWRIGDVWLDSVTRSYGRSKVEYRHPGGCWSASTEISVRAGDVPPPFMTVPRVRVEGFVGPARVWLGFMDTIGSAWTSGELQFSGLIRQAETAVATGPSGGVTLDVNAAIYWSDARGAFDAGTLEDWGVLAPDTPVDANTVDALLEASAQKRGRRERVDENGLLWSAFDATSPTVFIAPGTDPIPVTTDAQVTGVWLSYTERSSLATRHVYVQTPHAGAVIERIVDWSEAPSMTTSEATALANRVLSMAGPRAAFAGSVSVPSSMITNQWGVRLSPALLRGGVMARQQGVRDPRPMVSALHTDFVVGSVVWDCAESMVTFTPVDAVGATFAEIVEQLGGAVR